MIKLLNNFCKFAFIFLLTASTSFAADMPMQRREAQAKFLVLTDISYCG